MKEGTNKELHTYRAVIHGDRVEWISGKPETHIPIFADIEDPVTWQREIRKDRPLPGRGAEIS